MSFFAYPKNFNFRIEILSDYFFLLIFNTDLAYDGLFYSNAFILAYYL